MPLNKETKPNQTTIPVDLEVMAMKGYSTFLKAPGLEF